MNKRERVRLSKFLSLVLRHQPESIGLALDPEGWAEIQLIIDCAAKHGRRITRDAIEDVVATSDKQRFALSPDGHSIRANQGHSTESVSVTFESAKPPPFLFHGTAARSVDSIREQGLKPMARHHVHLSGDRQTALSVGVRHGSPVVLLIDAKWMAEDKLSFLRSANGVWLVEEVPPQYILEWDLLGPDGRPEILDRLDLLVPWYAADEKARRIFQKELIKEVALGHVLFGRCESACLFARRQDMDDFAFLLNDGSVATVHLTFSKGPDRPPWPSTSVSANLDEWVGSVMMPDHEDWIEHDI